MTSTIMFVYFQEQMVKLENLSKLGARIQPQKDGSVIFRTTETTTSAPVPGTPGSLQPQMPTHPQIQVSQTSSEYQQCHIRQGL